MQVLQLSQSLWFHLFLKVRQRQIGSFVLKGEQITFLPTLSFPLTFLPCMPRRDFVTDSRGNKTDDRGEEFSRKLWLPPSGCHMGPRTPWVCGVHTGVHQERAWQPGLIPPPQPGTEQPGDHRQPQPRHWPVPWGWPKARPSHGPVSGLAGRTQGRAGEGCEELENSPAVAWPGQKLSPAR